MFCSLTLNFYETYVLESVAFQYNDLSLIFSKNISKTKKESIILLKVKKKEICHNYDTIDYYSINYQMN